MSETKLRWGCRGFVIPLYALAALLEVSSLVGLVTTEVHIPVPPGHLSRLASLVFLAALALSINDKINRKSQELSRKIDESVGAAWDAGKRSGKREAQLESQIQPLPATVRRLVPRR